MKTWTCRTCGYEYTGEAPPKECPQCSASSREFVEKGTREKLSYDGGKFDVLIVNASNHSAHGSRIIADLAEKALTQRGIAFRSFNLNEHHIEHCWCCYSMRNSACTYPCRNQHDDMPAFHEMLISSRAVIVVSPINWNGMSARLKDFLDRLTCIQNRCPLKKKSFTIGKVLGILVNGHEDGGVKTAMDIFVYFQQMGYILAPFGFTYRTHGAEHDTRADEEFFGSDERLRRDVDGVVNNVVETMRLETESEISDRVIPVCE